MHTIRLLLLYDTIGTNINYTLASKLALRAAFIVASMEAALALNASEAVFFIPAPRDATTDADNFIDIWTKKCIQIYANWLQIEHKLKLRADKRLSLAIVRRN